MKQYGESCVLENRLCTECGECDRCELNSEKTCDNCCQCIESTADFAGIEIEEIIINTEDIRTKHPVKTFKIKNEDI